MLLADIGNTNVKLFDGSELKVVPVAAFDMHAIEQEVIYASVNHAFQEALSRADNFVNIETLFDRKQYHPELGIDRILAISTIENGVVLDAGSAITVEVVKEGDYVGGYILPGVYHLQKAFASISPVLDCSFNFDFDLATMPENTTDAMSYGMFKPLYHDVKSYGMDIILTGGDARKLKLLFKEARVDELLLFHGMKKLLEHR